MADRLSSYRQKRSSSRTTEPVPEDGAASGNVDGQPTFVVQEHHARSLHWDFRLEHDGVLVSWAVPKGLPDSPRTNHLAVQTEDHPLEYGGFEGTIPAGEYGAGEVEIWDRGVYECQKWTDREVKVVLHGRRADGEYVLIHTGDKNWLMHKTRGRPEPPREAMPRLMRPMLATLGEVARNDDNFGYETKWDGVRIIAYLRGGPLRLMTRNDIEVSAAYPELSALGAAAGGLQVVLDGEVVAFDQRTGRSSFGALQSRMHLRNQVQVAHLADRVPVTYCIFDVLYLDGRMTTSLPYVQRRELLEGLDLNGPHWRTPPYRHGGGAAALAEAKKRGEEGVMAKRLDSLYETGRRSRNWIKIKNSRTQEVVVGGWQPGKGARAATIGSLLLGIPDDAGLSYVGKVGTGFSEAVLDDLRRTLSRRGRRTSPFAGQLPTADARDAQWVTPKIVGEVEFAEWTRDGRLRQPRWRGLRPDKPPEQVVRESP